MREPIVGLVMPHRGGQGNLAAALAYSRCTLRGVKRLELNRGHSLLTFNFNLLLSLVLNERRQHGLTHFAMLHNDVCPEDGWLDVLLAEMDATGADLASAVVPIKNQFGCTSTALDDPADLWFPRRLTLTEVHRLPETFGVEDVPYAEPDARLLANTGCFVVRLDRDWSEDLYFRQQDRIERLPDGRFEAQTIPEDWDFSRQVADHGGKVVVTRKVQLYHERPELNNVAPWGEWKTDEYWVARRQQQSRVMLAV